MAIVDFILSFFLCLLLIAGFCYLLQINLKGFTVIGLNAIAGFNLSIIFSLFGAVTLTGLSGIICSILGPVGSIVSLFLH